ncbi:MAG TPA: acyl-CoA thioesterase [Thermomicrobiales bacterium]|jgi:acyl-CoA thioester hydrolase
MATSRSRSDAADDGFQFKVEVQVRFRDLDAMNHVNNAVYMTYFEIARLAFWAEIADVHDAQARGLILAEQTCTYRSPARHNEVLDVWLKPVAMRRSSFVYHYRITERQSGRLIATGRSVQVAYDYEAEQSIPLQQGYRAALEKAAGHPLPAEE